MSKQTEALKLALEALEAANSDEHRELVFEYRVSVITALREALAEQPRAGGTLAREPLTDEMVTVAARALNKRQAEACGVDKNDHWKFYGDDIKEDARAVLEAAHGITGSKT